MPLPSIRERQRRAREEAILDGAQELLVTRGYDAVTMDDLASALGISKATLYQHFASKRELAVTVITRFIRQTLAHVRQIDATMPPLRRIEALIGAVLRRRYAEGHPGLGGHIGALLPAIVESPAYLEVIEEIAQTLSGLIEQGKESGDIDPTLSTPVLTASLLGLLRNTDYQPLIESGRCTVEDVRHAVSRLVVRGVQPDGAGASGGTDGA